MCPDCCHLKARAAWPRLARNRPVDRQSTVYELVQPNLARVALRQRVRRDETKAAVRTNETCGAQVEERNEVRTCGALSACNPLDQVLPVIASQSSRDESPAL